MSDYSDRVIVSGNPGRSRRPAAHRYQRSCIRLRKTSARSWIDQVLEGTTRTTRALKGYRRHRMQWTLERKGFASCVQLFTAIASWQRDRHQHPPRLQTQLHLKPAPVQTQRLTNFTNEIERLGPRFHGASTDAMAYRMITNQHTDDPRHPDTSHKHTRICTYQCA